MRSSGTPTIDGPSAVTPAVGEHPNRPGTPAWIRLADGATLVVLCAAGWAVITGGMRTSIAGARISITSPVRLAILALAIAVVRHAVRRRPSLLETARTFGRPRRLPAAWSAAAPVWAVSRLSVIFVGYFAVLMIGLPGTPPGKSSDRVFANLPARWDATFYLDIAVHGYEWGDAPNIRDNVAFFPAFPLMIRAGGALLGAYAPGTRLPEARRRLLIAGWLIALCAFWFALLYVYRWAEDRAGPTVAAATITLLAAYPFAVFFSAPYTESVYLLGVAAALFHAERAEWFRCAGWGVLVGSVRPNGVLLTIPLALIAARGRGREAPRAPVGMGFWAALASPVAALFLHSLYLRQLTGRWFAWSEVQVLWGRTYEVTSWLGLALAQIADQGLVQYLERTPATVLDGLAAALAFVLLWPVLKTAGLPYAAFVVVTLVPALLSGGLMSVGRFTSTLFPLFFALAVSIRERSLLPWILAFSVLQGLLAVLFFTWRPPV